MSGSSTAVLEFAADNVEGSPAAPGSLSSLAFATNIVPTQQPPTFIKVLLWQTLSDDASYDKHIAKMFSDISGVKLISRQRSGDSLRFYVLIDDSDFRTMERVFDVEKLVYDRFPDDDLDFEVLPGEELRSVIPTGAILLWHAA